MTRLPKVILAVLLLAFFSLFLLAIFRSQHNRNIEKQWRNLDVPAREELFTPDMLIDLPAPAIRYFQRALQPGQPLASTVRLKMNGQFHGLKNRKSFPLTISQLLTPHRGFVWEARIHTGLGFVTASDYYVDGSRQARFHYLGLIPTSAQSPPDAPFDYTSPEISLERMAMDTIFCPAALLPRPGVQWQAIDSQHARVHLKIQKSTLSMLLQIAPDGRLLKITVSQSLPPSSTQSGRTRTLQARIASDRTFDSTTIPAQFLIRWSEQSFKNGQKFSTNYDILELEVADAWFK